VGWIESIEGTRMSVVLIRIDDRLIHGQVVEGWVKKFRIDHIVVCNDDVAGDVMQKNLLRLAVPSHIKASILTLSECIEYFLEGRFEKGRVMILISSPSVAFELMERGINISEINVGVMHYMLGKKQILKSISVSDEDIKVFRQLAKRGVKLEARTLPGDERFDILKCIENKCPENIDKNQK